MTRTHALKVVVALSHLVLVICGAARVAPAPRDGATYQAIVLYGEYSGSNNGYGFFAPSVASPWDVQFSIYADGEGWVEGAVPDSNREVQLRVGTILGALSKDNLREAIAASLAASKFTRHPHADLINAHVRFLYLPTMAEHRAGQRPEWITVSAFSFAQDPTGVTAGE